jgi:hypothetical protein
MMELYLLQSILEQDVRGEEGVTDVSPRLRRGAHRQTVEEGT